MGAAALKRSRAARHARGRARRRARSDRARGVAQGAPTRRISVVSAAWFSSVLSYLSRALLMPSSALLSSSLSIAFPVSLGRSSLVLAACCRWVIRHHLRGRGEESSFIIPAACFSSVLSYSSCAVPMPSSALLSSSLEIAFPVSRVFLCDFCGASLGDSPSFVRLGG